MTQDLRNVKGTPTLSDVFTQHISDILLEVEAIKSRNLKKDADGIEEHLARIESVLSSIVKAKLVLAERIIQSRE